MNTGDPMITRWRNIIVWGVILAVIAYFFWPLYSPRSPFVDIRYDEFIKLVEEKRIAAVTFRGEMVSGTKTDGDLFRTYLPVGDTTYLRLVNQGVQVRVEPRSRSSPWPNLLSILLPFLLLVGLWMTMLRQVQGKHWLTAENGTLVKVAHIASVGFDRPVSGDSRYSIIAAMVTGSTIVIKSNLGADEARRHLDQIKKML